MRIKSGYRKGTGVNRRLRPAKVTTAANRAALVILTCEYSRDNLNVLGWVKLETKRKIINEEV